MLEAPRKMWIYINNYHDFSLFPFKQDGKMLLIHYYILLHLDAYWLSAVWASEGCARGGF